jgi:hypothetical protein
MTAKPSKLALLFREISELGGKDASFLANVILCHHRRPMKKLNGLAKLLRAGHRVQIAQFHLDVLVIDGERTGWKQREQSSLWHRGPRAKRKWSRIRGTLRQEQLRMTTKQRFFSTTFSIEGMDYRISLLLVEPSIGRKAFRFSKQGGDGAIYDLHVDDSGTHCQCLGYLRHGHCKHDQGCRTSLQPFLTILAVGPGN